MPYPPDDLPADPPIDPNDFRSERLHVLLARKGGKRGKAQAPAPAKVEVRLCELRGTGFLLEAPAGIFQKDQETAIQVFRREGEEFPLLEGTVRVESVEREDTLTYSEDDVSLREAAVDSIGARLVAYREEDWQSLLSIFSVRQAEIEEFLKAARGR
jgi:hypothetical protein